MDLSNSAVKSDLLTAPHVAQGEALSSMANRAGAAAGVNGDFFDIDSTQASLGGEIQAGAADQERRLQRLGARRRHQGRPRPARRHDAAGDRDLNGTDKPVVTLNAASSGGVPAGSIIAYTSAWGSQIRSRSVAGVANVAEVLVQDDKVVEVHNAAGTGAIPDGAYYLVGRDAGADAIKALKPGDPVTLTYGLKDTAAQQMQWAIGTNKPLIQNGVAVAAGRHVRRAAHRDRLQGRRQDDVPADHRRPPDRRGGRHDARADRADAARPRRRHGPEPRRRRLDDARRAPARRHDRDAAQHALRRPGARRPDRHRPLRRPRRRQGRRARRQPRGRRACSRACTAR